MENEQADAGRDGRTRLARPIFQARIFFPCSAVHEQNWQPCTIDPYSAFSGDHTHMHTVHDKATVHPTTGFAIGSTNSSRGKCYDGKERASTRSMTTPAIRPGLLWSRGQSV